MSHTRVKICGIRDPRTAEVALDAGADAVGVVFVEGSPRCVDRRRGDEIARTVLAAGTEVAVVAVVSSRTRWWELVVDWPGSVQVHGPLEEAPAPGATAHGVFAHPVIRAFPWSPSAFEIAARDDSCAALLVDGPDAGRGRAFEHRALTSVMTTTAKPIIVAGGLQADTVAGVIELLSPYGVDVSSSVESSPGVKDSGAMKAFCTAVREADRITRARS